jgi:hypothetical protein
VVVLLDTDKAGSDARDALVKQWLTRYHDPKAEVLSLGPGSGHGAGEFAIEDLFPDDFYLTAVKEVNGKQLAATGKELKLVGNDMLVHRVERAFADLDLKFNKGSVAKLLRHRISRMKTFEDLPKLTQERGSALIEAINKAFGG